MNCGNTPGVCQIALCSEDRLRRDTLAAYLGALPDFAVVGLAGHTSDLISLAALQRPELVLMDGGRQPSGAAPIVRLMRERFPATRMVLLHERLTEREADAVRECGAAAAVAYADGLGGVLSALRTLVDGTRSNGSGSRPNGSGGLTVRQREVLMLLASGRSVGEISERLSISPGTVENHKRRVYAKLSCATATEAVARAASLGIIESRPPAPRAYLPPPPPRDRVSGTVLVVVVGNPGTVLDRVVATLIRHRLPVVREHLPNAVAEVHWARSHRGPVVRVLVNPTATQWWVGATLGWTAVLVHDGVVDRPAMDLALTRGVLAAVSAGHVEDQLVPVLNLAAAGYLVMDPATARPFNESVWAGSAELPMAPPALTPREHDILREIGRSHTVRQTARALGIALKTVENAQSHLFRKLGVHNRTAALAKAYSFGLLQPG